MTAMPLSTASISIAGRAGHAFPPAIMMQGFACHARGVELSDVSPLRVRARVRSKRLNDVELRVDGDRLVIACTCPARSLGLDVCEHAWAALLEIDRRGGLEELRERRGILHVQAAPFVGLEPTADKRPAKAKAPADGSATANEPESKPPRKAKGSSAKKTSSSSKRR
jgi:hypothetical protein